MKNKFEEKKRIWNKLLADSKVEINKMIKSLNVEGNRAKKKAVEDAVFIGFLNTKLEETHEQLIKNHFAMENIYKICVIGFKNFKTP